MKKNIKIIGLIYIGVALFTYVLTLRVDHLESQEDYQKQSKAIVLHKKNKIENKYSCDIMNIGDTK